MLALLAFPAQAASRTLANTRGTLTSTFTATSDDFAEAVALQSDGAIVAAGSTVGSGARAFALARYRPSGQLDGGFGTSGRVKTSIGSSGASAEAVAIQSDGKIVAGGASAANAPDFDFALVRYQPDGTRDASFGSNGTITTSFGPTTDTVEAIALQPDGKVVAAGSTGHPQQGDQDFAVARYKPNGSLDPTFGFDGKVATGFPSAADFANAVALQPDGKIIVAGATLTGLRSAFALVRYNADGTLDEGFGAGGQVRTSFADTSDIANAVAVQPNGKIVVAGYAFAAFHSDFALARYNADGTLDTSFGAGGKVTAFVGVGDNLAWALALQPDGKILAGGSGHPGSFALARFHVDGSLDQSFGSGGKVTTAVGPREEGMINALALQPDGKLVAAGWTMTCTNGDFALARYNTDGALDRTFAGDDKRCLVPAVKGKPLGAAKRAITRRGCTVGLVSRTFSRTVPKGRVVRQQPKPGTYCLPRMAVTLIVSRGKR